MESFEHSPLPVVVGQAQELRFQAVQKASSRALGTKVARSLLTGIE